MLETFDGRELKLSSPPKEGDVGWQRTSRRSPARSDGLFERAMDEAEANDRVGELAGGVLSTRCRQSK